MSKQSANSTYVVEAIILGPVWDVVMVEITRSSVIIACRCVQYSFPYQNARSSAVALSLAESNMMCIRLLPGHIRASLVIIQPLCLDPHDIAK